MDKVVNILLVDDEWPALENLKDMVEDLIPESNIFLNMRSAISAYYEKNKGNK